MVVKLCGNGELVMLWATEVGVGISGARWLRLSEMAKVGRNG